MESRDFDLLRDGEKLLLLTDNLPVYVAYVDSERHFRFNNKPYEELFCRSRSSMRGLHVKQVFGDPLYDGIRPQVDAALGGQRVSFETVICVPGSKPRYVTAAYVPHVGAGGIVLGFISTVMDITERKNLEEQLRHSQRFEAIGRLSAGIAHDFNNLLTVISGHAQMILAKMSSLDPLRSNVTETDRAAARAAGLTRQLLAFGRRQVLRPKILDLNTVVRGMEKMLQRLIGEDIDLVTSFAPALDRIEADPGQLEQVIMNLVVNARDAMPHGGRLILETSNVLLDEEYAGRRVGVRPGGYVRLAVSDTGVGMDETTRSKIFEPFFTTKAVGRGTGLGLATVYGIVKQSGGNIWVYSVPGRGTSFKIYLPRAEGTSEPLEKAADGVSLPGGSETILLVEDDEGVRSLVASLLASKGYTVLVAESGERALHVSARHEGRIDLLLTDVIMPAMSGAEVARALESTRKDTKALYMSGYSDSAIVSHGILAHGTHFIEKPFTPLGLLEKIREIIDAAD